MSTLSVSSSELLFESPFSYCANEAEINHWKLASIPSLLRFSNIDIFGSSKDGNNKPYSPFNDYFGLAGIIKSFGNATESLGEEEQVYPIQRREERNILSFKSPWQSNSIHHSMKQTLERENIFKLDDGMVSIITNKLTHIS